ncbi:DUF2268 domain-containing putative Zn-dependent protease [Maricaulis sp.]|uniref:DUF2268 domain-containing putative Zn-dependent protease n=1 Tax=Maricaulis sp. TaxID=1486257 RepID=UPI0026283650|nr:DUF2268 domain-containing putative Zn-dependent protease [Maricaulis sp.]
MLTLIAAVAALTPQTADPVSASFTSNEHHQFSDAEMALINDRLDEIHATVDAWLPHVSDDVNVRVEPVNRPILDTIGGVTGRADQADEVLIEISVTYPGGIEAAVDAGLASTFAHELHHTAHGWTMQGNHFGYGIQIAVISEGLASVFAEEMLGETVAEAMQPPAEVEDWALEILALPQAANYGEWMFSHPDGRQAVGYRTGLWVVRRAMERSGLSIVELSERTPSTIWRLAGFEWDRKMP